MTKKRKISGWDLTNDGGEKKINGQKRRRRKGGGFGGNIFIRWEKWRGDFSVERKYQEMSSPSLSLPQKGKNLRPGGLIVSVPHFFPFPREKENKI